MQSTEREEFKNQLVILCSAFNVPIGDREEAYSKGLSKMSLIEFARVVEHVIGEGGPERIPTTGQCWNILRTIKSKPVMQLGYVAKPQTSRQDNLAFFANRIMLRYLIMEKTIDVWATLKIKNRLVKDFAAFIRDADPDATKSEFVRRFIAACKKLKPMNAEHSEQWKKIVEHPAGQIAFPQSYAERIDQNGEFDFASL